MSDPTTTQLQLSVPQRMGTRAPNPMPDWDTLPLRYLTNRQNMAELAPKKQISSEDKKRLEKYGFHMTDQKLGEGNYGAVVSCLYENPASGFKTHLACKKISLFRDQDYDDMSQSGYMKRIISRITRETTVTQLIINNPNDNVLKTNIIVGIFYPKIRITQPFNYYIFMEVADDDLEDFVWEFSGRTTNFSDVHGMSESDVKKLIKQIAAGVDFLHNAPKRAKPNQQPSKITIVHRDIKPDNVFFIIQNGEITFKLADFGFSQAFYEGEDILSDLNSGTLSFYGPEMLNARQWLDKRGCDPRVTNDVYAIGATAFYCWIGMGEGRNKDFIYNGIDWMKDDQWDRITAEFSQLSREFCQFLQGCCDVDPKKRFNLEQCINDPWLSGVKDVKHLDVVKEFPDSVEKYRKIREEILGEMPPPPGKRRDSLEELRRGRRERQGRGSW